MTLFPTHFNPENKLFYYKQKMEKLQELKTLIASMEEDFKKFYEKGNASAGTRIRQGMQELKNKASEIRKDIQETKNKA